jgi:hypothetical protein
MTVITVQPQLSSVELVTIRDWLHRLVTGINHGRVGIVSESGGSAHRPNADYYAQYF